MVDLSVLSFLSTNGAIVDSPTAAAGDAIR